jgi:hypothetical protein
LEAGCWLTTSDAAVGDELGEDPDSVAISGNKIIAGSQEHPHGTVTGQGAVYVFHAGAGGWHSETQSAEMTEAYGATDDSFGYSVAICQVTVTGYRAGSQTVIGTGKSTIKAAGTKDVEMVFNATGEHLLGTHKLKVKLVVRLYSNGKLKASASASANLTSS